MIRRVQLYDVIIMKICNFFHFEPCHEKTCFLDISNNKGTDQPDGVRYGLLGSMTASY